MVATRIKKSQRGIRGDLNLSGYGLNSPNLQENAIKKMKQCYVRGEN